MNDFRLDKLSTPKRKPSATSGKSVWYGYYAGYSEEFVKDVLCHLKLSSNAMVMDPWNGSGTTTQVAAEMGYRAIGCDINPVMILVAKARLVSTIDAVRLTQIGYAIATKAKRYRYGYRLQDSDPLEHWMSQNTAVVLRKLQRAIHSVVDGKQELDSRKYVLFGELSEIASFYYVALFRMMKVALEGFKSSNPTWVKVPKSFDERISLQPDEILALFNEQVDYMIMQMGSGTHNHILDADFAVASSTDLPIIDNSVDAVITSPPYCTRIDYAIATRVELAILGYSGDRELKQLRKKMIGTPTIIENQPVVQAEWGKTCIDLLERIKSHSAKASGSYYYKTYVQYFDSIYRSFKEINRTLVKGGTCTIVVQDSYYKDVHVDLGKIFVEMATSLDWSHYNQVEFRMSQTLAGVNKGSGRYRKYFGAVESALFFQKSRQVGENS